jgi:large subunit ribosomal protein L35
MNQKLKTHKGAAKRFKLTGTGKVKRRHSFARHLLTNKSSGRKRKLGKSGILNAADTPAVLKMLPYG